MKTDPSYDPFDIYHVEEQSRLLELASIRAARASRMEKTHAIDKIREVSPKLNEEDLRVKKEGPGSVLRVDKQEEARVEEMAQVALDKKAKMRARAAHMHEVVRQRKREEAKRLNQ
jgi:hypothetical protein